MMRGLMPWMGLGRTELDRLFDRLTELKWDVASFKNGLLTVTLPKTLASKGTTIPIKSE